MLKEPPSVCRTVQLSGTRVPAWTLYVPANAERDSNFWPFETLATLGGDELPFAAFRAVSISALERVLATGIDVTPTTAPIYVGDAFSKAWEYGGWPKLMLAYDWKHLKSTYLKIDAGLPSDELALLRNTYPTLRKSKDGTKFWLSKLQDNDPRVASPYESDYARWIPGDPFDALMALLIFQTDL